MKKRIHLTLAFFLALSLSACSSSKKSQSSQGNQEPVQTYISNIYHQIKDKAFAFDTISYKIQTSDETSSFLQINGDQETVLFEGQKLQVITNGTTIFYSKVADDAKSDSSKRALYQYELASSRETLLKEGKNLVPLDRSGNNLYYASKSKDHLDVSVYHLDSDEEKHLVDGVDQLKIQGTKILAYSTSANKPIYLFNTDGTGKKKLADGIKATIVGSTVYYMQTNSAHTAYTVYKCTLDGTKNKRLSEAKKSPSIFSQTIAKNAKGHKITKAMGSGKYEDCPPDLIYDQDSKTTWVANPDNGGINDVITISFEMTEATEINLLTGFAKSEKAYKASSRIRRVTLMFEDGIEEHDLADLYNDYQTILLDQTHHCEKVTIRIDSTYPGSKTPEKVGISEIIINPK